MNSSSADAIIVTPSPVVPEPKVEVTQEEREPRKSLRAAGIVGCSTGCGKTILMSGISVVLAEQNIPVRALKPICIGDSELNNSELLFISTVTGTKGDYERVTLEFPPHVPDELLYSLQQEVSSETLSLIEFPGSVATPLALSASAAAGPKLINTTDVLKELNIPVILVASHEPDAFELIELAVHSLTARNIDILALATVETDVKSTSFLDKHIGQAEFEMLVFERFRIPYLGRLKHSQSISVSIVCHGNLKKISTECLDTMVLRRVLQLPVAI